MALQNNLKDRKVELDPETERLLNEPLPENEADLIPEDTDPIDDKLPDPENSEEAEIDETPVKEETKEEVKEPVKEDIKEEGKEEDKDQKYKEQRREAEILNEQRKGIVAAYDEAEKVTVTEDEVKDYAKAKGGDWDVMSDFEKGMAKDSLLAQKKDEILKKGLKTIKDADEWALSVDKYLDEHQTKQTHKGLIGREDEFRQFAMKASHRGVGMEYLVPSFLYQVKEVAKRKGSLLLHGGGGEKPQQKAAGEVTDAQELQKLRVSNPKEYRRLLKSGKNKVSTE